jgi:hypothetical protein
MQPRLDTLRRLVTLYSAVEEMHAAEMERLMMALREARDAICVEQQTAKSVRIESQRALSAGDSLTWRMAETKQLSVGRRQKRLEQIRVERDELSDAAREQYVASRLKREQMDRLLGDIATRTEVEEGRRNQAASDDRFLARRRWTDARNQIRSEEEIKLSSSNSNEFGTGSAFVAAWMGEELK